MRLPAAVLFSLLPLLPALLSTTAAAFVVRMSAAPTNPSRLRLVTNKRCPFAQKVCVVV